ncbi:hypothetical protein EYW49_04525 [Siculibacillus lacustris]|uniref:Uncharacterized protein n=1 Tax=Siculibacillus lacustris TaxID=1549641 RepID=A0A4Q9VVZ8_9HYPH|nr:hypothetical protein [Siculibacillus lacustris]TBW40449.1 hypothetical protein EYW49_04525 [Siculibacillus lacustris]
MFDASDRTLKRALDELGRRIRARTDDFRERGEFSDVHAGVFEDLEDRREALRAAVDAAVDEGHTGTALLRESRADLDALVADFEGMLFHTAAAEMRAHRA